MSIANKKDWRKIKKKLPKDWRLKVQQYLQNAGVAVTLHTISNAKSGKLKNYELLQKIMEAIKFVAQELETKREEINKIASKI